MASPRTALVVFLLIALVHADDTVVETQSGAVHGKLVYLDNRGDGAALTFYGIPYAAPPVGKLRFQPPQPVQSWKATRDCTNYAAACPQDTTGIQEFAEDVFPFSMEVLNSSMSEDCLTLDVYTPTSKPQEPRPVMVWIHGGAFKMGFSWIYDGRAYAIQHNLVVVTIQYRIGILGFLTTGDEEIAGNMGFLDQVAALNWVQDNIQAFGGDPNQVTIFGESAGAMSVSLHLMSATSKGLFQRAILQSGSAAYVQGFICAPKDVATATKALADLFECPTDSKGMKECLGNVETNKLIFGLPPELAMFNFVPVTDGVHIPVHPSRAMKKGLFDKGVAVMAGVCVTEGAMFSRLMIPEILSEDFTIEKAEAPVLNVYHVYHEMQEEEKDKRVVSAMMELYLRGKEGDAFLKGMGDLIGDTILTYPTYQTAKDIQENSDAGVYFYQFAHKGSSSPYPVYVQTDHADDVLFMFGLTDFVNEFDLITKKQFFNEDDNRVDRQMTQYWANFAKTGNPNAAGLPEWPELDDNGSYLEINMQPSVKTNFEAKRMEFWQKTAPAILSQDIPAKEEL